MAANSPGKRKLLEELVQALGVLALIRVDLGISSFEIRVSESRWGAMSRARDVNHVQIVFFDEAVQMDPDETLTRIGSPMPDQTLLKVFELQGLSQQRVFAQIQHAKRKIIACAPIGIDLAKLIGRERYFLVGRTRRLGCQLTHSRSPPIDCGNGIRSPTNCNPC